MWIVRRSLAAENFSMLDGLDSALYTATLSNELLYNESKQYQYILLQIINWFVLLSLQIKKVVWPIKIVWPIKNCVTNCVTSPRHWNAGLVSSRASLTSWGEGASLALVGCPSSDEVTIKMPYGVDVLHQPASHPILSYRVGQNWIWLYYLISWDWVREVNASGSCD